MTGDIVWSDAFQTGHEWLTKAKALQHRLRIPGFPFGCNPRTGSFAFKNEGSANNLHQDVEMIFAKLTDKMYDTQPGGWRRNGVTATNGWIWFR